jgi:hypothetical protein
MFFVREVTISSPAKRDRVEATHLTYYKDLRLPTLNTFKYA